MTHDFTGRAYRSARPATAARPREDEDYPSRANYDRNKIVVTPWTSRLVYPKGLRPKDFQVPAIRFALSRNFAYLGLDPGLGKTICAAIAANTLDQPIVYVCPPFLALNVEEEFRKWSPRPIRVAHYPKTDLDADLLIVPDSIVARPETTEGVGAFVEFVSAVGFDPVLIVDEAHRFKNEDAKRSRALLDSIAPRFERVLFMSGTPMPNRPKELYPVLSRFAPETIDHMNFFQYGRKYCAAKKTPFGWEFDGYSNMPELKRRVQAPTGPFMYRLKKDVLDLPPITREVVVLGQDLPAEFHRYEQDMTKRLGGGDLMKYLLAARVGKKDDPSTLALATYRRLLGFDKVKPALEFIRYDLEETESATLVFAIHTATIRGLAKGLAKFNPLVITGETPKAERHRIVKEFQTNPKRRLVIANITAAGVGLTLTKATNVDLVEFSWVPGENSQAIDRAHRIGQDRSVRARYFVYRNSIEKNILSSVLKKQKAMAYV